jgi:hypothetical protein
MKLGTKLAILTAFAGFGTALTSCTEHVTKNQRDAWAKEISSDFTADSAKIDSGCNVINNLHLEKEAADRAKWGFSQNVKNEFNEKNPFFKLNVCESTVKGENMIVIAVYEPTTPSDSHLVKKAHLKNY